MDHEHEIPGHGPTRILALEEGDAPEVPHEVEAELRKLRQTDHERHAWVLRLFRIDYHLSEDKGLCVRDWTRGHPGMHEDFRAAAIEVLAEDAARFERFAPLADIPAPPPEPMPVAPTPDEVGEPTPGAIAVLALTAALISMVLAICALFGAPIGIVTVLAPVWGSALAVALAGAVTTAIAWAGRDCR